MKAIKLFTLAGICAGMASCIQDKPKVDTPNVYTDTLTYKFTAINTQADDCKSKADTNCTSVKFKYPVFDNQPLLNDTVVTRLAMLLDPQKGKAGLQILTGQFLQDYKDFKRDEPDRKGVSFELDGKVSVVRQDSSLVTLAYDGYMYAGGAHGSTVTRYINWDVKADKKIELENILKPGYETELNKVAEKIFRKQENLTETASLKDNYFFKDDRFALNKNFLITPLGLTFLYNQYEIKPYAAGQTTVDVPYAQIKTLIQPGTVTARYTK
ncbi:DUF3298 and DUF4163 domain-containing protein [Mucilaginibacter daejeonensis]|uniref:DUF3298 and DUF4163 domain-containing protein n=1 Tax=Mucilaginibacter daejeonensis TaxID=398049 RepID=UPI001D17497D|nr:DUF3298 and DUF4163 domain-containing protein [Mucilaginibacter daejeonensis]UEG54930.1 DUF3298 and DUF4163 domain-containing protein [Mucilaginibacter daejeonensis]